MLQNFSFLAKNCKKTTKMSPKIQENFLILGVFLKSVPVPVPVPVPVKNFSSGSGKILVPVEP